MSRFLIFVSVAFSLFAVTVCTSIFASEPEMYDLSVEYMNEPLGLDAPAPRLSWKARSDDDSLYGLHQLAYRVYVASSPELLAEDKGDLWDSGKIESSDSLNIAYAGKPLETSQRCFWKVRTWYETKDAKKFEICSKISRWTMGIMKPEDWKAKWIGSNEEFRPDYSVGEAEWVWGGETDKLDDVPEGVRYYRAVISDVELEGVDELLKKGIRYTVLAITADDQYRVFINGKEVTRTWGHFNDWKWMRFIDITEHLKPGKNVIGVEVRNTSKGPSGLLASIVFHGIEHDPKTGHTTDLLCPLSKSYWTSSSEPLEGWNSDPDFSSEKWLPVKEAGPIDCEPWGKIERRFEKVSPAFAKTFSVGKKVKTASLHITGVGFYEASLNGKKIGNKVLDPMQTRYDKRVLYSSYELDDLLKNGENRLNVVLGHGWYDVRSVAVWNFDNAPWRDFPRMIAQLEIVYEDGTKEYITSDENWDQTESPIALDCIRQGEASMKSLMRNIGKAVVVDAPKGKLVAEAAPASVVAQELVPKSITEPSPGVFVVDFGQNIAGWIRLKIPASNKSLFVKVKYAERLANDGNVDMRPINEHYRHHVPFMPGLKDMFQVDQFRIDRQSENLYEPRFMYHGFQYVEITGLDKKPESDQLVACVVHNDFKTVGKFECSNELFNKIQEASVWAYKGNFVNGVPTDCPHREKNGWTGDAQLASEMAQYNFDNTACYEKWINDLLDEQRPDGNLPGIVPTSGWGYAWGNGPAWDSAIIIIPWYMYEYKGDKRILENAYEGMKKYLDYLQTREKPNGLVDHGLSDWCFAKTSTPAIVTSSIYYYIDAKIVSDTAKLLGKTEDAEKYAKLAEKIKTAYNKELRKEDGTISNASQVAQSFALYYGAIDSDEDAVAAKLFEAVAKADDHLDVGILGAKSLFHTLSRYVRTDLAMKILNQKTAHGYGDWIERGATTLWEDWGDGSSRNHVMYGDISTWFYQTLGGIQLIEPGFKVFKIDPVYPEGLDWVKAEHDSPYGPIKVHWKRAGEKIELQITVPPNTKAVLNDGTELGSGTYKF